MGAGGKIRELRNEEILKSVIRAKAEAVKAVTACEGQINKADAFQEKGINTEEESKHLAEGDGVAPGTPSLIPGLCMPLTCIQLVSMRTSA